MATTAGGLTTALVLWSLSGLTEPFPAPVRVGLLVAFGLALALRSRGVVSFPLPQAARQIPREVFLTHPVRAALRFGYPFGTGVRTYLVATPPYAVAAAILLLRPPLPAALALGAGFGLARGLLPLTYRYRRPSALPDAAEPPGGAARTPDRRKLPSAAWWSREGGDERHRHPL